MQISMGYTGVQRLGIVKLSVFTLRSAPTSVPSTQPQSIKANKFIARAVIHLPNFYRLKTIGRCLSFLIPVVQLRLLLWLVRFREFDLLKKGQ